jgi:hypothetical protein
VGYTETDPYCRTHLGRTLPNAKGLKDHREATARVLRRLKVSLFVTSPPCMEHSSAHTKRRGGRSETGSWYAKCADEAIKAGVDHIIVECTTGVQERNGCAHSPLEGLISALQLQGCKARTMCTRLKSTHRRFAVRTTGSWLRCITHDSTWLPH